MPKPRLDGHPEGPPPNILDCWAFNSAAYEAEVGWFGDLTYDFRIYDGYDNPDEIRAALHSQLYPAVARHSDITPERFDILGWHVGSRYGSGTVFEDEYERIVFWADLAEPRNTGEGPTEHFRQHSRALTRTIDPQKRAHILVDGWLENNKWLAAVIAGRCPNTPYARLCDLAASGGVAGEAAIRTMTTIANTLNNNPSSNWWRLAARLAPGSSSGVELRERLQAIFEN